MDKQILKKFTNSQLVGVFIEPTKLWIRLDFIVEIENKECDIEFHQILNFHLSKDIDSEDGGYYIGEISHQEITDGGKEILSKMRYPFLDFNEEMKTFPSKLLHYFHLEGEVCVDIVCGNYKILRET